MMDHLITSVIFAVALGVIALCLTFPAHFMALGCLAVVITMLAAAYTWILDEVRCAGLIQRPTSTPENDDNR